MPSWSGDWQSVGCQSSKSARSLQRSVPISETMEKSAGLAEAPKVKRRFRWAKELDGSMVIFLAATSPSP